MKQLTIQDIRDFNPCYDPVKFLKEDWSGTVLDILNIQDCKVVDRLWVGLRLVDIETLDKFVDGCSIRRQYTAFAATYTTLADAARADYAAYDAAHAAAAAAVYAADAAYTIAYDKVRQKQLDILINILKDNAPDKIEVTI